MTIFYVVLYHIWRECYQIKGYKATTAAIYGLAGLRIVLCMMPQNAWLSASAPLSWGIYRNIILKQAACEHKSSHSHSCLFYIY